MSNVMKLAQRFTFVIFLCACMCYPGVISPSYTKSEPLLLLLSGTAIFAIAITVKRAGSKVKERGKASGLR